MESKSAPLVTFGAGKVILLGEHSVVYGHPALAGPLSLGVTARAVPSKQCQLVLTGTVSRAQRQRLGLQRLRRRGDGAARGRG